MLLGVIVLCRGQNLQQPCSPSISTGMEECQGVHRSSFKTKHAAENGHFRPHSLCPVLSVLEQSEERRPESRMQTAAVDGLLEIGKCLFAVDCYADDPLC